jgi:hypothetical protein
MSFIEQIKKQSTYGHLPNFGVLSKNKLYLPNSSISHCILGKLSLEWIDSDRYLLGLVEQDQFLNIRFKITSCYEFLDDDSLKLIALSEFTEYWSRVYTHDPYLSLIYITLSEDYKTTHITTPRKVIVDTSDAPNAPIKNKVEPKIMLDSPPKPPRFSEVKDVKVESTFKVCKTDKPDVYHVYQNGKYLSTCLIPNMKTSRYMQDLFENKNIGETVSIDMKIHEKTGKYYPSI